MQSNSTDGLTERFIVAVETLHHQLYKLCLEEWHRLEMTVPQIKTLNLLVRVGPSRMGNIASSLDIAVSAATTLVDRLVERELVERLSDPNDRRVVICGLTAQGHETMNQIWRGERDQLRCLADHLEMHQLESIMEAFEVLCRLLYAPQDENLEAC